MMKTVRPTTVSRVSRSRARLGELAAGERRHDVLRDDRAPAEEVAGVGRDRRGEHPRHHQAEEPGRQVAASIHGMATSPISPRRSRAASSKRAGLRRSRAFSSRASRSRRSTCGSARSSRPSSRSRRKVSPSRASSCSHLRELRPAAGAGDGLGPSPEEGEGGDAPDHRDERAAQEEEAGEREHLLPDRRVLRREGAHRHRLPDRHERDPEQDLPQDEAEAEVLDRVRTRGRPCGPRPRPPSRSSPPGAGRRGSRSRCRRPGRRTARSS